MTMWKTEREKEREGERRRERGEREERENRQLLLPSLRARQMLRRKNRRQAKKVPRGNFQKGFCSFLVSLNSPSSVLCENPKGELNHGPPFSNADA